MNTITIQINPNLRVDGDKTMADLDEDVNGGIPGMHDQVVVVEPVSGLVGRGWVVEIDEAHRSIMLIVDWSSLKVARNAVPAAAHAAVPNDQWGVRPLVDCVA